jgi:membrane-associated protein
MTRDVQRSAQGYTYPHFRDSESSTTRAGQPARGENANAAEKEAACKGNLSGRLRDQVCIRGRRISSTEPQAFAVWQSPACPCTRRRRSGLESIGNFVHLFTTVEGISEIIRFGGLMLLILIVFAETGLLVGFFLPGDSLLVTAGFLAATTDVLSIGPVVVALSLAAIVGDSTGYYIGKKAGAALYNRPQSRFFNRERLLATKAFYDKYGGITIVLARFMPFARTFAPVVAGVAEMNYRKFLTFNIVGGIGWVVSMSLLGYFFGQIPFVKQHIEKAIVLIIVLSIAPVAVHAWKSRKPRAHSQAASSPRR